MAIVAETLTPPRRRPTGRTLYWVLLMIVAASGIAAISWIHHSGHGYRESSVSMESTVRPGDTMLTAAGRGVRRGDVVILDVPPGTLAGIPAGGFVASRVIGQSGDRVSCCSGGRVSVDGKPLGETYVYPGDQPSYKTFAVTLGPGQLWVLGDHRNLAADSRLWSPVPVSDVAGRVVAVLDGGSAHVLRTPPAFVSAGLAPADSRVPWLLWALAAQFAALPVLVILIVFGLVRTLLRRQRARRTTVPS
jgi:signal peptidase I